MYNFKSKFVNKGLLYLTIILIGLYSCKAESEKNRILIVADEWPQMHALAQIINKSQNVEIDSIIQEKIQLDLLNYDYVLMYVHKVLEARAEQALIKYANSGGKLIVFHHGLASAKMKNPAWLEFTGIRLYPPEAKHGWKVLSHTQHTMVNLAPGHYITSNKINYKKVVDFSTDYPGVFPGEYQAFDLADTEIFLNQRFADHSKKKVLFGFISGDGGEMQPTSAWYQKTGEGWLFYFQAGHQIADFENKNFSQIILNTLNWKP